VHDTPKRNRIRMSFGEVGVSDRCWPTKAAMADRACGGQETRGQHGNVEEGGEQDDRGGVTAASILWRRRFRCARRRSVPRSARHRNPGPDRLPGNPVRLPTGRRPYCGNPPKDGVVNDVWAIKSMI
jgi:hypothetical protein